MSVTVSVLTGFACRIQNTENLDKNWRLVERNLFEMVSLRTFGSGRKFAGT